MPVYTDRDDAYINFPSEEIDGTRLLITLVS